MVCRESDGANDREDVGEGSDGKNKRRENSVGIRGGRVRNMLEAWLTFIASDRPGD